LVNLTLLGLSNNKLSVLPEEIGQFTNLTELYLSSNQLKSLPGEIGGLINLNSMLLSNNHLRSLPGEIGKLVNLTILALSNNHLSVLPPEIGCLVKLTSLELVDNQLSELPMEIGELTDLKRLYLDNNNLLVLPREIGKLEALRTLTLRPKEDSGEKPAGQGSRSLTSLPDELQNLKNLELLNLKGNSLPIPPEILAKTAQPRAILEYYFARLEKTLNECKVLVVGQGSVGKTSLIQRLVKKDFNLAEAKTEGIVISQWQLENSSSEVESDRSRITLNIWDFGGQEIMHATHQFFLTRRSLYLLVLDSRMTQEENRVEYWLKIIQSFAGESPVLIVGNKIDQHPLDIDRTDLQKKYPNIVGFAETSAATGAGVEELKARIAGQVEHLPHVRDLLPATWFAVKTQLEELGRQSNFITHDEYLNICHTNEIVEYASQRTLIGFLHDLGVVLFFQDEPRLAELGILNPQWVTQGVYRILNSQTLFRSNGVLTVPMLDEILDLPAYPRSKRLFIVDTMKRFELCHDLEPDKIFLVPDLLPKDEPPTEWQEDTLPFQYHYAVLTSSIITRFIVRMKDYAQEQVWRSGVLLNGDGCTALIKAAIEDRTISIWVGGDIYKRRDFLTKIRGQFDAIHRTISKLEVKEMVPVPGHPEAQPVDYDLLLQMYYNNFEDYPVLSAGKMIVLKVREMVDGVSRRQDFQRGNVTNVYVGGNVDGNVIIGDENVAERSE
jgi:internalin A